MLPHDPTTPVPHGFAEIFAEALGASPFTLVQLQQELARRKVTLSVATLSYWQTGRSQPARAGSLRALGVIEEILGLPNGTLLSALPRSAQPAWSPITALEDHEPASKVLESMGLGFNNPLSNIVLADFTHCGLPGGLERQAVRRLVCADAEGVRRFPGVFHGAEPGLHPPRVVPGTGIQLGEVIEIPGQCAVAVEFLFPHPLSLGELAWYEYTVEWEADDDPHNYHSLALTTQVKAVTMGAIFHEDPPAAARLLHTTPDGSTISQLASWGQTEGDIQFTLRNAPPGIMDLEWWAAGSDPVWS